MVVLERGSTIRPELIATMKAILKNAELATVDALFAYKKRGLKLQPFPGYTDDQWGIKAHNRPWIDARGRFVKGEKIAEVGGAYSRLPEYLAESYGTESWIIDDFGAYSNETAMWARWGNPDDWIRGHPTVRYCRHPLGFNRTEIPDAYFDCVFSVSTLEHIAPNLWPSVIKDMLRITKVGGRQLHSIDIPWYPAGKTAIWHARGLLPLDLGLRDHPLRTWKRAFRKAGVVIESNWPSLFTLHDRRVLMESADVVYRFYPPCNEPKPYPAGGFSLLVELERTE
jgi:hypothetical protein